MPRNRLLAALLATITVAACAATPGTPGIRPALFYAKDGSIYLSDPAGTPARRLTDGPADTEPAPYPDGTRLAFVRKVSRTDRSGELWVLDLPTGDRPGPEPRRLVDPAELTPKFDGEDPGQSGVGSPRWSPAGDRIAFLKTAGGGGFLLTAEAHSGAVQSSPEPLFADESYDWAPDGAHIAWTDGRSDVSPADVSVLTVGGATEPVARGTNAFAVAYSEDGNSILFANGEANGSLFSAIPFALRDGGIYSVRPPSGPDPIFRGSGTYADVAALPSGAIGFTEWSADSKTKSIKVIEPDGDSLPTVDDTPADAPVPAWTGDTVAYIGTHADRPLLVRGAGDDVERIEIGVEAFAWGPVRK